VGQTIFSKVQFCQQEAISLEQLQKMSYTASASLTKSSRFHERSS